MDKQMTSWREPAPSHRQVVRKATLLRAEFGIARVVWPCLVLDISPRGAGVHFDEAHRLEIGTPSTLRLLHYGIIFCEVRHSEAVFAGVLFLHRGARDLEMSRWLEAMHVA